MERTLKLERLYPLAQYANIKFVDEISALPEEAIFNVDLASKARYLQMLEVEIAFRMYLELMKQAETKTAEEVAKFLEEQRNETVKELVTHFERKLTASIE
jgi:hypothetical protein